MTARSLMTTIFTLDAALWLLLAAFTNGSVSLICAGVAAAKIGFGAYLYQLIPEGAPT